MPGKPVLILGGTGEARILAQQLLDAGLDPITSLAGVTSNPLMPPGRVRRGGFGGIDAMTQFLVVSGAIAVADATHPFAAKISANAAEAAQHAGVPYWRLERPAWEALPEDNWIDAKGIAHAASLIPAQSRVLVTTGRKEIAPFLARSDIGGIIRTIDSPNDPLPANWKVITVRPPYTITAECRLLSEQSITVIVAKNAGGQATRAKLYAAQERKIPVIMIRRPAKPSASIFWPPRSLADHFAQAFMA